MHLMHHDSTDSQDTILGMLSLVSRGALHTPPPHALFLNLLCYFKRFTLFKMSAESGAGAEHTPTKTSRTEESEIEAERPFQNNTILFNIGLNIEGLKAC